jgi:ubiquinone/menaquinone biosynthesis C-methylase UbiE
MMTDAEGSIGTCFWGNFRKNRSKSYISTHMSIKEPDQSVWDRFWARKQDLSKVYPASPAIRKTIHRYFLNVQGMKILEVGPGTGRDSAELAKQGADVYVLDFSAESLKTIENLRIREHLEENLHCIRGDAFHSPFPDNTFDLIFHQGLAEHFVNPNPLIEENFRIIKEGGYILCDVPQTFHIYTVIKHILIAMGKWFAGWETQFSIRDLRSLIQRAGFRITYEYGDWMRPNLFYRILRELCFKFNVELPKYPLHGTVYQKMKDAFLDAFDRVPFARYTQLSIGILAQKPKK